MRNAMRLTILGKRWNLRFARNLKNRGDCDPPAAPGKEIRVGSSLRDEERLEVVLHEMLHAAGWHIAEEFVDQFACDAARALWRLGYRDRQAS
jgi:hypothetical protein